MTTTTAAGTALAISTGTPATLDRAGYAALNYDEVGLVEKIGTIGKVYSRTEFQALRRAKDKLKGAVDHGALLPSMAYDEADAGQITLRGAANDNTARLYPVRVTFPNGEVRYFRGRVFGAPESVEGAETVVMTTATIEICTPTVKVPAGYVPPVGPVAMNLAAYGVTDWTPGIGVNRVSAGNYAPSKEYADLLADFRATTTVQQYFVDPVSGADANAGTSAAPWQRIHTAWTQAPAGATTVEIIVRPPVSRILWGPRGMTNGSVATKNIIVRAEDGGEIIVAGGTLTAAPAWTDNGDGTFTCSSGVTNAVVNVPSDWSPQARAESLDGDGRPFAQTITASALDATGRAALQPGQAHKNSSTGTNDLTIRPFGNRAASVWSAYVIPGMQPGSNFRVALFDSTNDSLSFFLSRVKPCGGTPFSISNQRTTAGGRGRVYMDRCGAVGTSGNQNALAVVGSWLVIHFDTTFDAVGADAINGHAGTNGNAAWLSGEAWIVSVRPRTATVGMSGSGVDNSDTSHENGRSLTIMPLFRGGNGRTSAFINTSTGITFGQSIGPSSRTTAQGYYESVSAGNTATIVLVEVTVAASPNGSFDISADANAAVKCYGMTQGALRTTGNVTFQPLL